jgi:hypothetical protein
MPFRKKKLRHDPGSLSPSFLAGPALCLVRQLEKETKKGKTPTKRSPVAEATHHSRKTGIALFSAD